MINKKPKKVHFVGVGGSGISGCANLAQKYGFQISGCDIERSSAYVKDFVQGHNKDHLIGIDLAVCSPAVFYGQSIDEIEYAKEKNILKTWQEFTGEFLLTNKKTICICGTHGKSTTSAMVAKVMIDAGMDPTVLIGAIYPDWKSSSKIGTGDFFVLEADEFNNNFLNYKPEIIILNNIEFDHPDYFKSETDVSNSFQKFIANLVGQKILICNSDSPGVLKLLKKISSEVKVVTYSKNDSLDFKLMIPGGHNYINALGVFALGKTLGIPKAKIKSSLESFPGIGRRTELLFSEKGIEVYDDYAHHPTEVKSTINALRERHPKARIWVIVEPHGYLRTKILLKNYKKVFDEADKVLIGPIFKARDEVDENITPELVAKTSGHNNAQGFNSFENIKMILKKNVSAGDVVLIMGAGKSYVWAREITKSLK